MGTLDLSNFNKDFEEFLSRCRLIVIKGKSFYSWDISNKKNTNFLIKYYPDEYKKNMEE